jgi:D-alanine-D-alanine ligase
MTIKDLRNIVVLMGGPGSEREVSLNSGRAIARALAEFLPHAQVRPVVVDGTDVRLPEGTDLVFIAIHGSFGEDGALQAQLEKRGVPYTGTDAVSSELAFDKIASKSAFARAGVPTPRWEIIRRDADPASLKMNAPLVVKPPREGSSVGVCIVEKREDLAGALHAAGKYAEDLLAEEFIAGRELTIGILGGEVLPIIEIRPTEGFYDYEHKYSAGGSQHLVPAPLDAETTARVQQAALAAHRSLGIQVYSRVDVRLDEAGTPWVLEVNTIPGMTATSLLPDAAAHVGYSFPALCGRIAELSLERAGT